MVGWQRIRKPVDRMEPPGELGPEAEPGGRAAVWDRLQVASSTITRHSQSLPGPRLPMHSLQAPG